MNTFKSALNTAAAARRGNSAKITELLMFDRMKRIIYVTLLIMTTTFSGSAETGSEQQVNTAIQELTKAMLHPSVEALAKLFSDHVSYGHSAGLVQNKAEIIDNLVNGPFHFLAIDIADQTIETQDEVAIVRQTMNVDYIENGVNGKYKFGILLVWHQENEQWKLLARQAIKL